MTKIIVIQLVVREKLSIFAALKLGVYIVECKFKKVC